MAWWSTWAWTYLSPSCCMSFVEPSISVKRNVTVPLGRRELWARVPPRGAGRPLMEQGGEAAAGFPRRSVERDAEARLGEVASEHARVVAVALHRARVARDAVPLQAERRLHQRAGKVHPGQGRAFPVRRLRGQPALAEA